MFYGLLALLLILSLPACGMLRKNNDAESTPVTETMTEEEIGISEAVTPENDMPDMPDMPADESMSEEMQSSEDIK